MVGIGNPGVTFIIVSAPAVLAQVELVVLIFEGLENLSELNVFGQLIDEHDVLPFIHYNMLSHKLNESLAVEVGMYRTNLFTVSSQNVNFKPVFEDLVHVEVCQVIDNGYMVYIPSVLTVKLMSFFGLAKVSRGTSVRTALVELIDVGLQFRHLGFNWTWWFLARKMLCLFYTKQN